MRAEARQKELSLRGSHPSRILPSSRSFDKHLAHHHLDLCPTHAVAMAQRVTLSKRQPYNTSSSRQHFVKHPAVYTTSKYFLLRPSVVTAAQSSVVCVISRYALLPRITPLRICGTVRMYDRFPSLLVGIMMAASSSRRPRRVRSILTLPVTSKTRPSYIYIYSIQIILRR